MSTPGGSNGKELICRAVANRASSSLVARANAAQPHVAALGLDERLRRAAAVRGRLEAVGDEVIDLAVTEGGIPRRFAARELASALAFIDALPAFAEALRPRQIPSVSGTTTLEWAPFGVALGWHAANSPIWVPTLVVLSGLVAGNAVISRPSQRVRMTTLRVLAAIAPAWPADAVVVADLPARAAERLIRDPGVQVVVAHSSSETCKRHLALLGRAYTRGVSLRPYIPEASGNDAFLILDGADLERAAHAAALGGFANSGQLCMSAKRMIVQESVWPAFRPLLVAAVAALVVGDPSDPRTDIAPMRPGSARDRARRSLAEALDADGEVIVGGGDVTSPTIIRLPVERAPHLELWSQESFAPVRGLVVARDPAHAVVLANDTRFGLGAAIFGGEPEIVTHLRAARVVVGEGPLYHDAHLVVGGVGDSGMFGARPKLEQLVWARRVHRAAKTG
jgi:acyl-CoA reductase-like NAD-dependent aldehyde dehydrogenase